MKRYDTYKESGIEWIGKIPNDWKINKIKYLATVINGSTPDSGIDKYWDGDIDWVTPADISKIQDNYISNSIRKITEEGLNNCGTTLVPKGSVILTTRAPIGNVAIAGKELCTNQGCKSLLFKSNSNFYYYQFLAFKDQLEAAGNGSTFKELSTTSLKGFPFVMPSKREKDLISSYLDKKTEQINQIIQQKELLLEKLQAKRQAIINETVTKGLNPNVRMKPSGVEWLGDIPESWQVKRIKHISEIQGRIGFKGYTKEDLVEAGEGALTLGAKHIDKFNQLKLSDPEYISWGKYYESPEIMVQQGDLVFTQRGSLGKVAVIRSDIGPATINPSMILLKNQKIDSEFFYYFLISNFIISKIKLIQTSTAVPMISQRQLGDFEILVPNVIEQKEIVRHLNNINKKFRKLEDIIINQIEKLNAYRQSLISEVVTGKIKVV
jgi:type I restriction enzyme S subunit